MNKEFLHMQKLAGLITEGQYKEKVNEAEADLLTPDGLHKFLHTLRNSINSGDKKIPLDMVNKAISSIADKLNEIEGDPDDYHGYNEPINPNDYAEDNSDPHVNDKIAYVADALQHVWNKGKGNNTINFDDMAEHIIDDLATRF